jgi:hypothetical protein
MRVTRAASAQKLTVSTGGRSTTPKTTSSEALEPRPVAESPSAAVVTPVDSPILPCATGPDGVVAGEVRSLSGRTRYGGTGTDGPIDQIDIGRPPTACSSLTKTVATPPHADPGTPWPHRYRRRRGAWSRARYLRTPATSACAERYSSTRSQCGHPGEGAERRGPIDSCRRLGCRSGAHRPGRYGPPWRRSGGQPSRHTPQPRVRLPTPVFVRLLVYRPTRERLRR